MPEKKREPESLCTRQLWIQLTNLTRRPATINPSMAFCCLQHFSVQRDNHTISSRFDKNKSKRIVYPLKCDTWSLIVGNVLNLEKHKRQTTTRNRTTGAPVGFRLSGKSTEKTGIPKGLEQSALAVECMRRLRTHRNCCYTDKSANWALWRVDICGNPSESTSQRFHRHVSSPDVYLVEKITMQIHEIQAIHTRK